eukprot:scaffold242180_cov48-Attheya_sp.AAC.1
MSGSTAQETVGRTARRVDKNIMVGHKTGMIRSVPRYLIPFNHDDIRHQAPALVPVEPSLRTGSVEMLQ